MSKSQSGFLSRLRKAITFRRAMPLSDALRLQIGDVRDGECEVRLRQASRKVVVRCNTSDSKCIEKIFVEKEYLVPFEIAPRFIVDAGANIGLATLYFASRYPEARIIAIEPEQSNFSVLERNCAGLSNVTLIKGALWPVQVPLSVHMSELGKWASWVSEGPPTGPGMVAVQAVTVPEIIQQAGITKIDLLKLDIEGAELDLFSQKTEDWIDLVDVVVSELHDRFRPGCARAFYSAITQRPFLQEVRGENIFIRFQETRGSVPQVRAR